jgi:two-component system, LuxR family, sensor kinase FixL
MELISPGIRGRHLSLTMYAAFFRGNKRAILLRAAILIAAIAVLDWRIVGKIPLGILYLGPMLLIGSVLEPWHIVLAAGFCTALAEEFDDLPWNLREGLTRDVLYFVAFLGAGLFIREINRNRAVVLRHVSEIERQSEARREAEEQLRILIESSPAAILTADASGTVLMANEAAHRMLGVAPAALPGRPVHRYLPSLRNVSGAEGSQQTFRTVMQARGQRESGETFLADISFSTYRTGAGLRLAAMVLDASEEFRTHEVSGLHQLLAGSRIAIGAMSHEIRNISGAIGAVHQNLTHEKLLAANRDFEALGNLIAGLERIANLNLRQTANQATQVDLAALLDELRIVIEPALEEDDIRADWTSASALPLVWADRPSLMQVFLNLANNSIRALASRPTRSLSVSAKSDGDLVLVEFADTGGGVAHPEFLFRPFQAGANASGLGLYLSRAFVRSFGGDLRYLPTSGGACFIVSLNASTLPAPPSIRSPNV